MPKSMKEVLDHADELARRFEQFDPAVASEISVTELALRRAVLARAEAEREIVLAGRLIVRASARIPPDWNAQ